jgi:predicted small secreted protein
MKRFLIVLLIVLVVTLTGCATGRVDTKAGEDDNLMFFIASREKSGCVIVDKTTRVMYWLSCGSYNYGTLTMLVNADGTPRIWEG